jgi:flavin reductase (DIM6/NTAB) family NADH-FMN oxidoreductase RutF
MASPATDPNWFRRVLGHYPTGVCAVTCRTADGTPAGFVVGSFTSVSLAPPLVAFFPGRSSTSWPQIEEAGRFCVNVIAADQEHLGRRFAAQGDRFHGVDWRPAPSGSPILDGAVAWLDCDLHSVTEAGDHLIVLGHVRALDLERPGPPLVFFQGSYGRFQPHPVAADHD